MIFSGFADEAGEDLETQIRATKELGWNCIELRNIHGINATDLSEEEFEAVVLQLKENQIQIPCFGSAIGNAVRDFMKEEDVRYSLEALERAFPRMKQLGCRFIRGMAFNYHREMTLEENEKFIFPIMEKIAKRCEEEGVTYLCENCFGYSGHSHETLKRLCEHLHSEHFRVVFDTGNPVGLPNCMGEPPYSPQSSFECYQMLKPYTAYIHIKDQLAGNTWPPVRTMPGEGDGEVVRIIQDLVDTGYNGYVAIEPHLLKSGYSGYEGYVSYGKKTMEIFSTVSQRNYQ